jgi:hypothetical protein
MVDDDIIKDSIYTSGEYAMANPTWDAEDSPWKAKKIMSILRPFLSGQSYLRILKELNIESVCVGYDIAPEAVKRAIRRHGQSAVLSFQCCDVLSKHTIDCDWCLLIDLLEHLYDPVRFLQELRRRGVKQFIVNLPLENSFINIIRGRTDPRRNPVGHLHFWDTYSALSILERGGLRVVQWMYAHEMDVDIRYHRTTASVIAYIPRKLLLTVAPKLCVHLLGGGCLLARCVSNEPDN